MIKKHIFILFLFLLLVLRTMYGLVAEFWEPDEIQVYLLGLNFYTSHSWPFFGPLVIYNHYQIPGALQAILTGGPLFLFPFPEAPDIFLNLITFFSLCLLSWYFEKRVQGLPRWLIWGLVLMLPWSVQFGTRIVNPSYLLVFSILFFIGFFELLPLYRNKLISPGLSAFMMGAAITFSMQLHLSWVLLIPFVITVFLIRLFNHSVKLKHIGMLSLGLLAGLLTLVPTLLKYGLSGYYGAVTYFHFQMENFMNFFNILVRFLSFSTYEVTYFSGAPSDRLLDVKLSPWMIPFTIFLLVFGFIQVAFFIISFFLKRDQTEWKFIKWMSFLTVLLLLLTFLFSQKGPSSHTFYILYPVSLIYSMYCYQYIFQNYRYLRFVFMAVLVSGIIYMAGLAHYKFIHKSLYINREIVQKAIDDKDCSLVIKNLANKKNDGY